MADQKISELAELLDLSDNDMFPVLNLSGNITDKVSLTTVREYVAGEGSTYFPDYNETDQGAAGAGKSVKTYIDGAGSCDATLIFQHNSGGITTTYAFSTSETIPSNVNVKIEKGAMLVMASGVILTVDGSFSGGNFQCFSGDSSSPLWVSFNAGSVNEVFPQWFGAVGDGITDDTTVIQHAIHSLRYSDPGCGGTIKFLPGSYVITSLTLELSVHLVGTSFYDRTHTTEKKRGTWFFCIDTINPAIIMSTYTTIENISFFYPNQITTSPPIEYPATIKTMNGRRFLLRNISAPNTYWFLDAATDWHEQLTIENVTGFAIFKGIEVDWSTDIDRISNVHFNPNSWVDITDELRNWTFANGIAFNIGNAEWGSFTDCLAFGYSVGFRFADIGHGGGNPVELLRCGADMCNEPFFIGLGRVKMLDCNAVSGNSLNASEMTGPAVTIEDGAVSCDGLKIWGSTNYGFYINGNAANFAESIIISNCQIVTYATVSNAQSLDRPAIQIADNCQRVIINGNHINGEAGTYKFGIVVESDVTINDIVITNNIIYNMAKAGIALESGPDGVVVTSNILHTTGGITDNLGAVNKSITGNVIY